MRRLAHNIGNDWTLFVRKEILACPQFTLNLCKQRASLVKPSLIYDVWPPRDRQGTVTSSNPFTTSYLREIVRHIDFMYIIITGKLSKNIAFVWRKCWLVVQMYNNDMIICIVGVTRSSLGTTFNRSHNVQNGRLGRKFVECSWV